MELMNSVAHMPASDFSSVHAFVLSPFIFGICAKNQIEKVRAHKNGTNGNDKKVWRLLSRLITLISWPGPFAYSVALMMHVQATKVLVQQATFNTNHNEEFDGMMP